MMVSLTLVFGDSAHLFYRLVQGHALHPLIVDSDDKVVGQNTSLRSGRFVDRRHHLDHAVFLGDFDAKTAELAAVLHLRVPEALRIHVARVRIKSGQHSIDRGFDQLAIVRLFDVIGAYALEDIAEQFELSVSILHGRVGARSEKDQVRLESEQHHHCTSRCAEQSERSLVYHRPFRVCRLRG